ncbi:MAG: CCA tRNA nucleotidyltransferase [Chloroflexi bacterium]|nr:CCA tRNA nucleotidyltransferase [Chloroflexota bacterium]
MVQGSALLLESRLSPMWMDFLRRAGGIAQGRGEALYLVGGVVRDLLLGRGIVDLDLVVEGDAIALARRLAQELAGKARTHPRFGTAKVEMAGWSADLASARSETYAHPGALPQVTPASIAEDLARRDFTVNAMAICLEPAHFGQLLDIHGGFPDLKARLIRILHPGSFMDDATRILRALRYEQRLDFQLESETEALMRWQTKMLDTISGDRLRHELELIFQEEYPEKVLARAEKLGVLAAISSGLRGDGWLTEALRCARRLGEPRGSTLELCFLLLAYPLGEAQVESFIRRLHFPAQVSRNLRALSRLKALLPSLAAPDMSPVRIYHHLHPFSPLTLRAVSLALGPGMPKGCIDLYLDRLRSLSPFLDGDDLRRMGVSPGPRLGRMLRALLEAKLEGKVSSREEEQALVKEWLEKGASGGAAPGRGGKPASR